MGHCLGNTLLKSWGGGVGLETREVGREPAKYNHSSNNNSPNKVLSTPPVSLQARDGSQLPLKSN